ncbi:NAD(P)-dependent oxidoreductase [Gammaproteobacteria bacterium]|nr:NAD(P)-dependent oxidoreductase [Gammaproteobacteria bacterium]
MKILILGGSGFIGSYLTKSLNQDNEVTVLSQSDLTNQEINCSYVKLEYNEKNFFEFFSKNNFDVIHFLSGNPHPYFSETDIFIDIELTINPALSILKVLREIQFKGCLWFSSSVAVYGNCKDDPLNENSNCIPLSNYAVAKITLENYAKLYASNYGLNIGVYRIFSTYGPGLNRQVIYDNIVRMQKNETEIILISSLESARDFSFVEDQALAIKFLSENITPNGDIFNLGSGKSIKIIDIVKTIAEIMEYKGNISCQQESKMVHDVSWTADINKISSLGFEQKYDLRSGLKETIKQLGK